MAGIRIPDNLYTRIPDAPWVISRQETAVGDIPRVGTELLFRDIAGSWKARWGINRMNFTVVPGLYCVGNPDENSPVFVTANYKMTFDVLRKELTEMNAWILVLDTKGINVWCAAAKGTFATNELINRIAEVKLSEIVSHKTLIVPQLGAVGVSAHEVLKSSGFKVVYGPVRAKDIKEFIASGLKATKEMRTVKFTIFDRLRLIPLELVDAVRYSAILLGIFFLLNLIGIASFGIFDLYAYIGAVLIGSVLTQLLLPWIPGRAFAWKGWLLGLIWAVIVGTHNLSQYGLIRNMEYLLILPPISAFLAMNLRDSCR
jgi:hypothetical protein